MAANDRLASEREHSTGAWPFAAMLALVGALVFAVLNLLIWCLLWEPRETEPVGDEVAKKED